MNKLLASGCTLEPQVAAHAREMFSVLGDPAIYEFENEPPPSEAWLAERFLSLESRGSADGREKWLNWVVRLANGELAGYVQATVLESGESYIAYELASRHWRQGIGSAVVRAMMAELQSTYGVRLFVAVLKAKNYRSVGLLRHLGFTLARAAQASQWEVESDELVMVKTPGQVENAV